MDFFFNLSARLVFKYTSNGVSGDIQLDAITLENNFYSFETNSHDFQTSAAGESAYTSVNWVNLSSGTTGLKWNIDSGGTPTSNTGKTDAADGTYYVYAETSSPATTGSIFWLRSPIVDLNKTPNLSFYETRVGPTIGSLNVYLDVVSYNN